jgi:hypothetical protein
MNGSRILLGLATLALLGLAGSAAALTPCEQKCQVAQKACYSDAQNAKVSCLNDAGMWKSECYLSIGHGGTSCPSVNPTRWCSTTGDCEYEYVHGSGGTLVCASRYASYIRTCDSQYQKCVATYCSH